MLSSFRKESVSFFRQMIWHFFSWSLSEPSVGTKIMYDFCVCVWTKKCNQNFFCIVPRFDSKRFGSATWQKLLKCNVYFTLCSVPRPMRCTLKRWMRTVPGRAVHASSSARPAGRWRTSWWRSIPTTRQTVASNPASNPNVSHRFFLPTEVPKVLPSPGLSCGKWRRSRALNPK